MGYVVKNVSISVTMSLTALRIFGFWLPERLTHKQTVLYYCYGFLCFLSALGSYIICQVVDLFQFWGNLPMMTATACLLFTNLAHFSKIVNVIARRSLIQTIINDAHFDLTRETSDQGRKYVQSCNFETKWTQLMYHFITMVTLTGWAIAPAKGQLPFPSWYPFDVTKSPAYELAYAHQVISVVICGYLNVAKDTLAVSLIAQCHCRLKLLGLALRTICNDMDIPANRLLTLQQERIVKHRLRMCVWRHQAALATARRLQRAFSEPTFIQFVVSLVIVCVTAFQLVAQPGSSVHLLSMACYLFNMMYQLFIYCYQGNKLALESAAVADAVYAVPWYACGVDVRRSLVVMSARSRRVARLSAGGFTPLSLNSFMAIMKASYSLFTLLQQVEERK